MSLWGATAGDEAKPKNLTQAQKDEVFATSSGWSKQPGGNDNAAAQPEVLVALGNLGVKLGAANLMSITLANNGDSPFDDTDVMLIDLVFNERVTVTGTPQLGLAWAGGGTSTGNAEYLSGSGTNQLRFDYTILGANVAAAGEFTLGVSDDIDLNGGTMKDDDGTDITVDMTIGGPDSSTDIKAVFDASVATIVVTA